ncbi:MAG: SRPBCC family protein [Ginsengibacter sp.]
MRKIIFFIISALFLIGLLFLLSMFLPSKTSVTKSIGINAPSSEVYKYVNDFQSWPEWFLPMQDSSVTISFDKEQETVTLTDLKQKKLIFEKLPSASDTINIALRSRSASEVFYQFILIPQNAQNTQLVLNVNTHFKWYPWEKIKGVFQDKMSGPMYQKSILQLEKAVEGKE